MGKSALTISTELLAGAERARAAGDHVASLALALKAAEYLQLAKILGDAINETSKQAQS